MCYNWSQQTLLATNAGECKGYPIHSHKSNDDSHEASSVINHQGTLGFCSRLLIDLPPTFPVETWEQYLLLSFKLIQLEPSLRFSLDQISNPSIHYMCFPVCAPQAEVIVLHKSTAMHTCTSVKAPPSGCGFIFGNMRPFEVIFPLIHYGGSFFFLSSWISARTARPVMSQCLHKQRLGSFVCVQWLAVWGFLRVFHICVG